MQPVEVPRYYPRAADVFTASSRSEKPFLDCPFRLSQSTLRHWVINVAIPPLSGKYLQAGAGVSEDMRAMPRSG